MTLLGWILGSLALVSAGLNVWQWLAARRFPLHRRAAVPGFSPGVTLLKPLDGCDAHTEECLRSWFQQDYAGPVQLLFAVASADDPACAVVNRLRAEFPQAAARLVVCGTLRGANPKVAKLAELSTLAVHDVWVISDADVRVPPDYLANAVAPLADPGVGLVFSFYRLANPVTAAMRWEAVAVNADFWSQVLQSRSVPGLDFALGAVMTTRRAEVGGLGGFAAIADHLADDYQLGHRIAARGRRIEICPVVVECWNPPQGWRAVWVRQLRWARTIRVCTPVAYFFSMLSNATIWAITLLLSPLATCDVDARLSWSKAVSEHHWTVNGAAIVFAVCVILRAATAESNYRRLTSATTRTCANWLVWLKDLLQFALWVGAFLGNTVTWRGVRYQVQRDGTLRRRDAG